jgi:hypothetical protein
MTAVSKAGYPFSPNPTRGHEARLPCKPGVTLMLELNQDIRWLSLAGMDRDSYAGQPVSSESSQRSEVLGL